MERYRRKRQLVYTREGIIMGRRNTRPELIERARALGYLARVEAGTMTQAELAKALCAKLPTVAHALFEAGIRSPRSRRKNKAVRESIAANPSAPTFRRSQASREKWLLRPDSEVEHHETILPYRG